MSTTNTTPTPAVKVVAKKRLSDGAWAITLRVNDDPTTDTVHTLYARAIIGAATPTAAELTASAQSWLADRKTKALANYASASAIDGVLPSLE